MCVDETPEAIGKESDMSNDDQEVLAEVLAQSGDGGGESGDTEGAEFISSPSKVLRIGSMVKTLLEEAKSAPLDEASRARLRGIYQSAIAELSGGMSTELAEELQGFSLPFDDDVVPSEAELRIAQAQLVGWLEGLFHGIQATLYAQQMAARSQLEEMRGRQLPQHSASPTAPGGGNYL
jgi:hypothetical protein